MNYRQVGISFSFISIMVALLPGCVTGNEGDLALNSPPENNRYGAIAFSESTQRWHIRWNVSDQAKADVLAERYCGTPDCSVVLRFGPGQCGTFALGDNGALGVGSGEREDEAAMIARNDCSRSGQVCKVAPIRCNDPL